MSWRPPDTDEWVPPDTDEIIWQRKQLPYQPSMLERAADVSQSAQEAIVGPVAKASNILARGTSKLMFGSEKPAEYIQQGVGKIAQGIENVAGMIPEGLGYINSKIAPDGQIPESSHLAAGVAGTALATIPYLMAPAKKFGPLPGTETAARRTIYGKQNLLKKVPGGIPQAEANSMEMLNKGVIGPFSSKETMLGRAEALAEKSGGPVRQIPKALDSIATKGIDAVSIADDISKQLKPALEKGAFKTDVNTLNEIIETVKAAGPEASFSQAQTIKEKLQMLGSFPKGQLVDQASADKIRMFRRASGIFNKAMEKTIQRESPRLANVYEGAKASYGPAASAVKGLSDAYITEAANVVPSIRATIAGAEALGRRELGRAGMLIAGYDFLSRKGAQLGAYALGKAIPSTALSPNVQRAIYSQFIDRVTTKDNQETR